MTLKLSRLLLVPALLASAASAPAQQSSDLAQVVDHMRAVTTMNARPVAHINTQMTGYYIFNVFPLVTSDKTKPGEVVWFDDTVSDENAVAMLTAEAKKMNANAVADLVTHRKSGLTYVGALLYYFLWYKDVEVCGNAVN